MGCEVATFALKDFAECSETLDGARIATHCIYPSFETVHVYIAKIGDSFRVHDAGGAYRSAWSHGRDERAINKWLSAEASKFHLDLIDDSFVASDVSEIWLTSAILSVANASARAASNAVSNSRETADGDLLDRIGECLKSLHIPEKNIAREYIGVGKSGGSRRFDFAIRRRDSFDVLINGISPHPASVSAKYLSFSDADVGREGKIAVYDKALDTADAVLLGDVASLMSFRALPVGIERAMAHA